MSPDPPSARIAFLHSFLPAGGATIYLLNLAGQLVERGISSHVFTLSKSHPLARDFQRRRIPVSLGQWQGTIFEDRISQGLSKLARFAPQVVVANVEPGTCEMLRRLPRGVLRIGVVHALSQANDTEMYADVMDHLVGVSEYVVERMRENPGLQGRDIRSIQPGVQLPPSRIVRTADPGFPLRILYLGRLDEPAKRVRLFPEILRQLCSAGVPFIWTIAGEGPERAFLARHMRSEAPAQQIRLIGSVEHAQVPALLVANDVLLLTSDTETFSLSLHEGMAAGLVPVASDLPGPVRDAVTEDAGILVPPDDVGGYARAIVRLHQDRAMLASMSAQSQLTIGSKHSVEVMADRWQALWANASLEPVCWPEHWPQQTPRCVAESWRFTRPGRFLRRVGAWTLSSRSY
jgi:glycosyltransferase involved in cell wall biosynthesis